MRRPSLRHMVGLRDYKIFLEFPALQYTITTMPEVNFNAIVPLSPEIEERIRNSPLLNIDTFIIPSPYIKDSTAKKILRRAVHG